MSATGHTGPLRMLTPGYASPEELHGEAPGVRGDVFSLGKIFGELLTELAARDRERSAWASRRGTGGPVGRDLRSHLRQRVASRTRAAISHRGCPGPRPRCGEGRAPDRRPASHVSLPGAEVHRPESGPDCRRRGGPDRHRRPDRCVYQAIGRGPDATAVQAARSDRLLRFVLGLFEGGDRGGAPAADLRVVSLLERGVREARSLDDDPRAQAEMFLTLGRVYQELGDLESADDLLTAALDSRLSRPGEQPADVVMSLVALSELRLDQARLDDAQQLAEDALERATRTLGPPIRAHLVAHSPWVVCSVKRVTTRRRPSPFAMR